LSRERWWLRSAPLALALVLGACAEPSGTSSQSGGGKADSPWGEGIAESAMQVLPERPGMIDLARDPANQWSARLIGPGGEIYLQTKFHSAESSAANASLGIKENGVLLERYQVAPTDGGCSFELRAANHQVIATGPSFATCAEANAAVEATRELIAGVVQFEAAVTGGARFELWREPSDGKWRFALRAADQRVLLASQTYSRRLDAVGGITSVRANGKLLDRYRTVANQDGSLSISLKAGNGQEIAASGPYPTAKQAQAVVDESVQLLSSERVGNPW
jgi:uncharacterized protein YegP (UPF0339 family)